MSESLYYLLYQGEVYSSVSDMTRVFQLERDLVSVIHTFKQKTEQKLERIKKWVIIHFFSLFNFFMADLEIVFISKLYIYALEI